MPVKCTKCKTGIGQVTLGKRALKCYNKLNHPNCSADDLFCKRCNDFMEEVVKREVARQKKRKLMERRLRMSLDGGRSSSSSFLSGSLTTIVERVMGTPTPMRRSVTPNTSGARKQTSEQEDNALTSPEIQYTQSQSQPMTPRPDPLSLSIQDSSQSNASNNQLVEPVRHEYEEDDSDDEQPVCPIAGPSTSAAVTQPIVRKRKTAVVFADERIIPIYNQRRDFGG